MLLPTSASLVTETLAKSNTATENLNEENLLEEIQIYSRGHVNFKTYKMFLKTNRKIGKT